MTRTRVLGVLVLAAACGQQEVTERVPNGTWGGQNAGMLVSQDEAHVHLACTVGSIAGPIPVDAEGAFDVEGRHNVDAFPVNLGIEHPARFFGRLSGGTLTLSVRLTDTGQVIGPVTLTFGREPQMQRCPICRR